MILWKPLVRHCIKYDSFFHSAWNEKKMTCFELCVLSVLTQNLDIWNFHGSLTLNNLIFLKPLVCHCVKYDSFFILFGMRKKLACFELCVSSVLTENEDIWNFHGSLTLNKGKLI